jgi:hypothetical protein
MSTGKLRSWPSDEKPVPKSSIAMRNAERVQVLEPGAGANAGRAFLDDGALGHFEPEQVRRQLM